VSLPPDVVDRVLAGKGPVLVVGGARSARLRLAGEFPDAPVLGTDLGLPLSGPPGAISVARHRDGSLIVDLLEALCTLDTARFRLPLVLAVDRLVAELRPGLVLVEVPGVNRGMAGAELLTGLCQSLSIRLVLELGGAGFRDEVRAAGIDVVSIDSAGGEDEDRSRDRTGAWDRYLHGAEEARVPWSEIPIVGAPPPRAALHAWPGRQVGVLGAGGRTLGFGEISSVDASEMQARIRWHRREVPRALLVRDARRNGEGSLETERREEPRSFVSADLNSHPAPAAGFGPPVLSLTAAKAFLVNGIFGDPLLHVRLRHRKRSLLFDLGDAVRLPARIVHQVSDVFVSHAHFDHFGGFLWLLRSSIGAPRPRRVFGPPGLADRIEGMLEGILWDRIGDRGPVFEVHEVGDDRIARFRLQAGRRGRAELSQEVIATNVLVDEPDFTVRSITLDHGVPVLAFSFEESRALHVRPEALAALGLEPGPWLNELKRLVLGNHGDDPVELPDGSRRDASTLGRQVLYSRRGERIVYATDFDDSEENRARLTRFAQGARVLFCEASFLEEDRHLARATQHLTARACAEIARDAGVAKLVPFHFSKRYESDPGRVYREVREAFPGAMVVAT
jgi:ribonuclease BN (tRNA processing enzyme)